jgi:spore coat protein U-like protein
MVTKKMVGLTLAGAMALTAGSVAQAATASQDLAVGATVNVKCTISTAALAFGVYDPVVTNASTALDGTGTVSIACTRNATANIGLGLGGNASGSTRRMSDGTNMLTYELYSDAGRTTVWGNAAGSWLTPVAAPSKAVRNFTVYGRVTANQDVPAGDYDDTVVATVNF